jgi:hypothetical protein
MKRKLIWASALGVVALIAFIKFISIQTIDIQRRLRATQIYAESYSVLTAVSNYSKAYGKIPGSDNGSIVAALISQNPGRITFLHVNTNRINSVGQYTDPWKTPFQIQITNQDSILIRSAGRNRAFGDNDDVLFERSFGTTNSLPLPSK